MESPGSMGPEGRNDVFKDVERKLDNIYKKCDEGVEATKWLIGEKRHRKEVVWSDNER